MLSVLFSILFTLYIDDLLKELSHSSVGCYWENIFVGALAYADDLTLLAPSPSALRKPLAICTLFLGLHSTLTRSSALGSVERDLEVVELHICFVASISAVLSMFTILDISWDLQNDLDIQRCKRDFIRRANSVLSCFGFCTPKFLTFAYLLFGILWVCTVEFEQ